MGWYAVKIILKILDLHFVENIFLNKDLNSRGPNIPENLIGGNCM